MAEHEGIAISQASLRRDSARSELGLWYSSSLVDEHMIGVGNVVQGLETTPGPIVEAAMVTSVSPGQVTLDGQDATADGASIHYRVDYGGADVATPAPDNVIMCRMSLHKSQNLRMERHRRNVRRERRVNSTGPS
jgi:hypothetical protein